MNPLLAWLLMLCVHTVLLLLAAWAIDTLLPSLRAVHWGLMLAALTALAGGAVSLLRSPDGTERGTAH